MPMLGSGDSAKNSALAALQAAASGGPAAALNVSPYRIPVRTGGASQTEGHRTVGGRGQDVGGGNAGLYGDSNQTPEVNRFTVDNNGVQAAIGSWYAFDDAHREALMKKMWYMGLTKTPTDFDGAFKVWQAAVGHAASFASVGKEIDPQDVLTMLADPTAVGNQGKYRQQQTTSRAIDLTDPATAKQWVTQAFQQSMGRDPDPAEIRTLVDTLHTQQRANPTVTTNTPTKWDANGNAIESTTTHTGGVDPTAFFAQQVASDPEAGAHQAAAQLFPALLQALKAGG